MQRAASLRNATYSVISVAAFLTLSHSASEAAASGNLDFLSALHFAPFLAITLLALIMIITSPIWVAALLPRRWMPDGSAVLGMWGICNAVLPLIPFLSDWVLWQYL